MTHLHLYPLYMDNKQPQTCPSFLTTLPSAFNPSLLAMHDTSLKSSKFLSEIALIFSKETWSLLAKLRKGCSQSQFASLWILGGKCVEAQNAKIGYRASVADE